jgi:hypothetical protein
MEIKQKRQWKKKREKGKREKNDHYFINFIFNIIFFCVSSPHLTLICGIHISTGLATKRSGKIFGVHQRTVDTKPIRCKILQKKVLESFSYSL